MDNKVYIFSNMTVYNYLLIEIKNQHIISDLDKKLDSIGFYLNIYRIIISIINDLEYSVIYINNVPLIFEVRDLWPSSLIEILNLKPWHPLVLGLSLIEKHAYRHAKQVVSLLEFAKPYTAHGYTPETK
mgnify:CR=1 FL=1